MTVKVLVPAFATVLSLTFSATAVADVRVEQRTQMKLEGMLGSMMGMFAGDLARDGLVTDVVVIGDRKATTSDDTRQIVDLAEQRIYDVNLDDKTYTVTTFTELRERMEEARRRAEEAMAEQREQQDQDAPAGEQPNVEIDFDVRESGQRQEINGFDSREVITTITVRQRDQTLEDAGGLVMTVNAWMTDDVPALAEVNEFDRRYAEALAGAMLGVPVEQAAQGMASALAMYPGIREAMERFQAENVDVSGTAVRTVMTFETVPSAAQQAEAGQAEEPQEQPGGLGGLMGGLARRMAGRNNDDQQAGGRATIMTMTDEMRSVSTSVDPSAVQIAADFREER